MAVLIFFHKPAQEKREAADIKPLDVVGEQVGDGGDARVDTGFGFLLDLGKALLLVGFLFMSFFLSGESKS